MKQWFKSKTYWFNISLFVSMSGVAVTYLNGFGLDTETALRVGFGLTTFQTLGNFYIRNRTNTSIGTPPVVDDFKGENV